MLNWSECHGDRPDDDDDDDALRNSEQRLDANEHIHHRVGKTPAPSIAAEPLQSSPQPVCGRSQCALDGRHPFVSPSSEFSFPSSLLPSHSQTDILTLSSVPGPSVGPPSLTSILLGLWKTPKSSSSVHTHPVHSFGILTQRQSRPPPSFTISLFQTWLLSMVTCMNAMISSAAVSVHSAQNPPNMLI